MVEMTENERQFLVSAVLVGVEGAEGGGHMPHIADSVYDKVSAAVPFGDFSDEEMDCFFDCFEVGLDGADDADPATADSVIAKVAAMKMSKGPSAIG